MTEIAGINAIARLAEGVLAEARRASDAWIEQENGRDVLNDPVAHYCATVRRAIMREAINNPDAVRGLCRERGMSPDDTEAQLDIMQRGAFVMSKRA